MCRKNDNADCGCVEVPLYEHDCDECIFLGIYKKYDLYYCGNEPTVIARYGNHGSEYYSGMQFHRNEFLYKAKLLAIEKGFIKRSNHLDIDIQKG